MNNNRMILVGVVLVAILAMIAGCSTQEEILAPTGDLERVYNGNKNGTETLGVPSIAIAGGTGFAEGGVGMVDVDSATLTVEVPVGTTVKQVLLYWSGGANDMVGDDTIALDGTDITGEMIGGPVAFFNVGPDWYNFMAFRADITDLGLVAPGTNSFTVTDFDFQVVAGGIDENNGVSVVVIYDDGTTADLSLVDGLDMAYFGFAPTLDATVPQTFTFNAEPVDRTADLLIVAGSVGEGRPNQIRVTTSAGDQMFVDALGSFDELTWDSMILTVDVPAGDSSLTVQLISTNSTSPLGASLSWLATGLAVARTPAPRLGSLGDTVWIDTDRNGLQDAGESGLPGVTVRLLDCDGGFLAETTTDGAGEYLFSDLTAGTYRVEFVRPEGYEFTLVNAGIDVQLDSDADLTTGLTTCITLAAGADDLSWDAGLYLPESGGCTRTIGYWKNHAGFGPQADVVTPLLPLWLGTANGTKSIQVTSAGQAVALLKMKNFGGESNGIAKLYAQLLAAKLNLASGASGSDVAGTIADADAFLATHDWRDWSSLGASTRQMVLNWKSTLDDYNNGLSGPGHCGEDEPSRDCDNRDGRGGGDGRGGHGNGRGGRR